MSVGAIGRLLRHRVDLVLARPMLRRIHDVVRLALYWVWAWAVWKSARNVERPFWTPAARALAVAGLGLMFLL